MVIEAAPVKPETTANHWAYIKPAPPELPAIKQTAWTRNGIDHFILKRLEKESLSPSPEATKAALVRRLYFDLIGLPPSPAEVDKFVSSNDPMAYEALVDQLLASPHYGERWARPWLDLARYADSNGFQRDVLRCFSRTSRKKSQSNCSNLPIQTA